MTSDLVKRVLAAGPLVLLEKEGFRKASLGFHRRLGSTYQSIGLQKSHGNVLGEDDDARTALAKAAEFFADRQGMSVADLSKRYGLERLG